EGRLLLARKPPVPPKEIADAKKELGGGHVFLGRLRWENEEYVFEVGKEPPGTLANTIRTVIHNHAGLTAKVVIRVAADLAAEEAGAHAEAGPYGQAVAAPPLPPPQADAQGNQAAKSDPARFVSRLKALSAQIQHAEGGTSPHGQEIKLRMSEVQVFARKQDFAQANAVLDQVEQLLRSPAPMAA